MKITIDTEARTLTAGEGVDAVTHDLYSKESFELLSEQWLRVGWSLEYYFTFSWMGLPIVQLPEDLLRLQEVLFELRPEVIVETGVYRGGSLMFLATLCKALDRGRVVGVDVEIPGDVRRAVEGHELAQWITLIEGDSVAPSVIEQVAGQVAGADPVLVILDSNHSKAHVTGELAGYARIVTPGSYLVVADGVMKDLADVPGGDPSWAEDNPCSAAGDFLAANDGFEPVEPARPFAEGRVAKTPTYWPQAWLRKKG